MEGFDSQKLKEIVDMVGSPIYFNNNGSVNGINRTYFAHLAKLSLPIIYESGEAQFYRYNSQNGLWEFLSEKKLSYVISELFINFCKPRNETAIGKCNGSLLKDISVLLAGLVEEEDFFQSKDTTYVHCQNCILKLNTSGKEWERKEFSPDYHSRNMIPIVYDPNAKCPQFLEKLIFSAMSKEDAEVLQLYLGQCLIGHNSSQMFLMMTGTAGGGKSTAVSVIEGIVGLFNCTELRLEHMGSRFELQRLIGKTLLTAKDVSSTFLNTAGASKLKALVGGDVMKTEAKLQNNVAEIIGDYNVIITANNNLRVTLDGDREAWRRRMIWIKYENPPPAKVIVDFDKKLLREEGSGILNWALEGAIKLMSNGGKIAISPEQMKRVDDLLQESVAAKSFVQDCVQPAKNEVITSAELLKAFTSYSRTRNWNLLPTNKARSALTDAMLHFHDAPRRNDIDRNGKASRGYKHFQIQLP